MAKTKKTASASPSRRRGSSTDPCTQYARDVTSGRIVAGPHVRAACARHLRDLEDGPARGLIWDPAAAERFAAFCREVLRLNGGEFEGEPFELEPPQAFIAGSLFGWKVAATGYRRFRVAYIEMGKGNGKSPFAAGIGLYGLVADGESRAEIYAAATKKDQAQILFRDAVAMVDQAPELNARIVRSGGKMKEWNLAYLKTGSFFRPIASDGAQSGPRPHVALLDEVHEHKSPLVVTMMRAGAKGRRQPLIVMITNSGTDRTSVCWDQHEYGTKVCDGTLVDDGLFAYICALDEGDDPFKDTACWVKANPLLGVSIQPAYIEEQVREARGMPSKESTVRRLNFCQWTDAANPLIGAQVWLAAADPDFDEDRLLGRRCYGGLDLSSTTDLAAFAAVFEPSQDDPMWRLEVWQWIPDHELDEKARRDKVPYLAWIAAGWLDATPGRAINKRHIAAKLVELHARYAFEEIAFDRWRVEDLKTFLEDEGVDLPLVPFGQGFQSMGPAVDEFERLLVAGDMKHDGNPVLTWNAASVVADEDPAGNRKPTKRKSAGRIDGAVAAIMACGRAAAGQLSTYSGEFTSV